MKNYEFCEFLYSNEVNYYSFYISIILKIITENILVEYNKSVIANIDYCKYFRILIHIHQCFLPFKFIIT